MPQLKHPILVISYSDKAREALSENLKLNGIAAISCSSFCEAENQALQNLFSGILVDLPSMIKAKGEEKIVACSLTGFYPTLRVRTVGSVLVPMIMPGSTKQDDSLIDFLNNTCSVFTPRILRAYKRHRVSVSVLLIHGELEKRSFTMNISWGGAFLVDIDAEKFEPGEEVAIRLPEFACSVKAEVRWLQLWGNRLAPGIGVRFESIDEPFANALAIILKTKPNKDRARLVA